MGINVAWTTETGEPKQEVFDQRQCLTRLATTKWPKLDHTKYLQFIEPWGDAVFNETQVKKGRLRPLGPENVRTVVAAIDHVIDPSL